MHIRLLFDIVSRQIKQTSESVKIVLFSKGLKVLIVEETPIHYEFYYVNTEKN